MFNPIAALGVGLITAVAAVPAASKNGKLFQLPLKAAWSSAGNTSKNAISLGCRTVRIRSPAR